MAKKLYAYVITDAQKDASFKEGDICLSPIQWHRGRSRFAEITAYDREKRSFKVIAKAVLIGRIDDTEEAKNELLKKLRILDGRAKSELEKTWNEEMKKKVKEIFEKYKNRMNVHRKLQELGFERWASWHNGDEILWRYDIGLLKGQILVFINWLDRSYKIYETTS